MADVAMTDYFFFAGAGTSRPASTSSSAVTPPLPTTGMSTSWATSYTIRSGDTLSGIAARHRTTVAALAAQNGIGMCLIGGLGAEADPHALPLEPDEGFHGAAVAGQHERAMHEGRSRVGDESGVIALPLALAFGVQSGMGAAAGLYGAIALGILAAALGGTATQASGPTGPMTVVSASVVALAVASTGSLQNGIGIILLAFLAGGGAVGAGGAGGGGGGAARPVVAGGRSAARARAAPVVRVLVEAAHLDRDPAVGQKVRRHVFIGLVDHLGESAPSDTSQPELPTRPFPVPC